MMYRLMILYYKTFENIYKGLKERIHMKKVLFFILVIFLLGCTSEEVIHEDDIPLPDSESQPKELDEAIQDQEHQESTRPEIKSTLDKISLEIPSDLALPFYIKDLGKGNIMVSPFGVIRRDADSGIGHGGIDIPLTPGDPIFAPADSKIIKYEDVTDGRGGNDVVLLLSSNIEGEGWIFEFEHVILDNG